MFRKRVRRSDSAHLRFNVNRVKLDFFVELINFALKLILNTYLVLKGKYYG